MTESTVLTQTATTEFAPTETAPLADANLTDAPLTDADRRDADATGGPFIAPRPMESDPDQLFPGDTGVLDLDVRRVLARLLQRRFLLAGRNRDDWDVLLDNQQIIESRLNDLFLRVVVDHDRGVAYKEQVRSDELAIPILLKDDAYSRAETLVLVHLRVIYQRESTAGEQSARVDIEDVEQTVLTYFSDADGDTARRQRAIRNAMERLRNDGIVEEESEGRYRITPLVEIVLKSERLTELSAWLRQQTAEVTAESAEGTDPAPVHDVEPIDDAEPIDDPLPGDVDHEGADLP